MSANDVAVCNKALTRLRASEITSLESSLDSSNEADICRTFYDDFVAHLLTIYPWTFARKKALLVATTDPINEWSEAHTYPAEALRLWALYPSAADGVKPINDYDISGQPGTRVINSNYSTLYAEYTVDISEANWPAYFDDFAHIAFAAKIAKPVTGSTTLAKEVHQEAWGTPSENMKGGLFSQATGIDAQQQPFEEILQSPLIDARFS